MLISLVGLDNAKRTLQEIVVLPALNPEVRNNGSFILSFNGLEMFFL